MRYKHTESVHLRPPGCTKQNGLKAQPCARSSFLLKAEQFILCNFSSLGKRCRKHPDMLHRLGSEDEAPCQGGLQRSHPAGGSQQGGGGPRQPPSRNLTWTLTGL